jgi:hypothetical protein
MLRELMEMDITEFMVLLEKFQQMNLSKRVFLVPRLYTSMKDQSIDLEG